MFPGALKSDHSSAYVQDLVRFLLTRGRPNAQDRYDKARTAKTSPDCRLHTHGSLFLSACTLLKLTRSQPNVLTESYEGGHMGGVGGNGEWSMVNGKWGMGAAAPS